MDKTDTPTWPERAIEMLMYLNGVRDGLDSDIETLVKMLAEGDYAVYEVVMSSLKGE